MKVDAFETFVVANPPPSFGGRYFIFVKLVADDGTVGYGEVYTATFHPHVVAAMIEDVCERCLIGHDPFHIEALWRNVYGRGYTARPDVSLISVLSGIEIACWDLIGKAVDKPVYELLGGQVHRQLRSYTYLYPSASDGTDPYTENRVYNDPELAAQRASEEVERGFTAVKFDPAGPYTVYDGHMPSLEDIERSRAFVAAIREAVGTRADLLFGTHGQFTAAGAIRLARALEPYDPMWFEEPVPPDNIEEMARVARQTSIPIATGERLTTKYEFARVVEAQAAAIVQPALGRSGGILETKKIASIAETHHVQIAPHLYCGPIEALANIALAACTPNFLILEVIQTFAGFYADLLTTPIDWHHGYVIPPQAPGLGADLNEDLARANPYNDPHLHLEPQNHPHPSQ
ncbi:MAG: mandelate racemase/muconate lactonizing enzyme family protein [Acidimicrobiaceae bacterium]|nr:mandelate racemase/muconate lactonizing enzyme family protein [Acidimicrobiia bacterium]MCY4494488.1 mandelate racemase/muconate lactonizing enzyme family protein [Acidimicrobiaceae bacterium]